MTNRHPTHTDALPVAGAPLDLQVRYHTARGRKLQSQAMGTFLTELWHGLPNTLPTMVSWLKRWNQRARTREVLEACSDRTLADIGIPREHIALIAKGLDHRDPVALAQHGWRPRLAAALYQVGFARPEQRQVVRELSAYSDDDLNDLGIRRSDIPQIARAA
jgi:uncharacterized protein YjiS (DUF1127 family)